MAESKEDGFAGSSLREVLAEIKAGKKAPCYLLYGEEEFQIHDALEKIVEALLPDPEEREFNLFTTSGDDEDVSAICESLLAFPLMPGSKVHVVRDTRLFESKKNLSPLITRIRERLESDKDRAVADFMRFLALAGLQLEDLKGGGWQRMDEELWQKIVPGDAGENRGSWLPKIVEIAAARGIAPTGDMQANTEELERILSAGAPEGNCVIFTAQAVDQRKKLFKIIASVGRILVFAKITRQAKQQQAVMERAAGILAKSGKQLSAGAWEALGQKTGFSLRESIGAIEKLITYSGDDAAIIEKDDVEAVVGRTKEDVVFSLTEAMSAKNLSAALFSLKELLEQGEAPLMIFAMMTREVRFLLEAKLLADSGFLKSFDAGRVQYGQFQKDFYPLTKQIAEERRLDVMFQHPYVLYNSLKKARFFKRQELVGHLEALAEMDIEFKTTTKSPALLLERFLVSFCRSEVRAS
jgi:DNA polymerase-3 subunit delta